MSEVFLVKETLSEKDVDWKDKPYKSIKARVSAVNEGGFAGTVEIFRPAFKGVLKDTIEGEVVEGNYGMKLKEAWKPKGDTPQPAPDPPRSEFAAPKAPVHDEPFSRDKAIAYMHAQKVAVELLIYMNRIDHPMVQGKKITESMTEICEWIIRDIEAHA